MATLVGDVAVALLGLVVLLVRLLYDYPWFVGLAVAGGLHWELGRTSQRGATVASGAEAA